MKMALDCVKYYQEQLGEFNSSMFGEKKIKGLQGIAEQLSNLAKEHQGAARPKDTFARWTHSTKLINAMADFLNSIAHANEISAFKTLTELVYVVFGVAADFEWPLVDAFAILHTEKMKPWEGGVFDAGLKDDEGKERKNPEEVKTIETTLKGVRAGTLASQYAGNLYEQINLQFMKRIAFIESENERLKKELAHEKEANAESCQSNNESA